MISPENKIDSSQLSSSRLRNITRGSGVAYAEGEIPQILNSAPLRYVVSCGNELEALKNFGSTSTPVLGSATTPGFGFGFRASNTPAFGSGAFGTSSDPAFGSFPTPAFGPSSSAFGTSGSPSFGFGYSPSFGQLNSTFGSPFGATPSPFGAEMSFGNQVPTPALCSIAFGGQHRGNRVTPHSPTAEVNSGGNSFSPFGSPPKANPFATPPSTRFGANSSPFRASSLSPFATSTSQSMSDSTAAPGTTSAFGQTGLTFDRQSAGLFHNAPSTSNQTAQSGPTSSAFPLGNFGFTQAGRPSTPAQPAAEFSSFAEPTTQSAPAAQSNPFGALAARINPFGMSTCGQSSMNPFSSTSSSNLFAPKPSLFGTTSSSSPFGSPPTANPFLVPAPTVFQTAQPSSTSSAFPLGNFGLTQAGGFPSISGAFGQGAFEQSPSTMVMQPTSVSNPFETLISMLRCSGSSPAIQCGISSMPFHLSLGTIVVALKFNGGLCFGAESRKTIERKGKVVWYRDNIKKIGKISARVYILLAGAEPGCELLVKLLEASIEKNQKASSLTLCGALQTHLSHKPHNSNFILCGTETDGSYFIKVVEPNGYFRDCEYGVCGSDAFPRVQNLLRDWHAFALNMATAQRTVISIIMTAILNVASCGRTIDVYTMHAMNTYTTSCKAAEVPFWWYFDEVKDIPLHRLEQFPGYYAFSFAWHTARRITAQ